MFGRESGKHLSPGQGRNMNQGRSNVSHFCSIINLHKRIQSLVWGLLWNYYVFMATSLSLKDTVQYRHSEYSGCHGNSITMAANNTCSYHISMFTLKCSTSEEVGHGWPLIIETTEVITNWSRILQGRKFFSIFYDWPPALNLDLKTGPLLS